MARASQFYRTVSLSEFQDLRSSGAFRVGDGAEGKYFWETRRDAAQFGFKTEGHYHPDGYRVVAADVPASVVARAFRFPRLDGIGPALFIDLDDLSFCSVVFLGTP